MSSSRYVRQVAIAAFAVLALTVLFVGREVLSAVFAGILFAVFLAGLSDKLSEKTRLSRALSISVVLLALLASFGGTIAVAAVYAPDLLDRAQKVPVPAQLRSALEQLSGQQGMFGKAAGELSAGTMRWGGYVLTIFFVGVFAAVQPGLYQSGLLALVPRRRRRAAAGILEQVGGSLRQWLLARAVSMIAVGVLSVPLFLLTKVPLAIPLAVFAGLLTFVPYFGPFIALVPVAAASLTQGTTTFLLATGGYLLVQTITGFIIDPLLQQRLVKLPAALILTSQLLLGVLIGALGVAVAAPFALIVLVLLRCLGVGSETA